MEKNFPDLCRTFPSDVVMAVINRRGELHAVNNKFSEYSGLAKTQLPAERKWLLERIGDPGPLLSNLSLRKIWTGKIDHIDRENVSINLHCAVLPLDFHNRAESYHLLLADRITTAMLPINDRTCYWGEDELNLVHLQLHPYNGSLSGCSENAPKYLGYPDKKTLLKNFNFESHFGKALSPDLSLCDFIKNNVQLEIKRYRGRALTARLYYKQDPDRQYHYLYLHDITSIENTKRRVKRKLSDLRQLNKEFLVFNFIAAHDLQEPLRKIRAFVNEINKPRTSGKQKRNYFLKIRDNAQRMQRILSDVLEYNSLKQHLPQLKPTNLRKLIHTAQKGIPLKVSFSGDIIFPVVGAQLTALLRQLMDNSYKFRSPTRQPRVSIHATIRKSSGIRLQLKRKSEEILHIRYRDNGKGFENEYAEKIFEILQRLDVSDTNPGTGIGLAICKRIAENHGGLISARGLPGKGACFDIFLPLLGRYRLIEHAASDNPVHLAKVN